MPTDDGKTATGLGPLREVALQIEPDRYIAATLAPRETRADLIAVAAFAGELARIPATVSEPMLGSIRLQWWRDALADESPYTMTGHPVADALRTAMHRHGLPQALVEAMIEAREFDLSGGLHPDDDGLRAYLDATEGHPFRLALTILGVEPAVIEELATEAACAYGLARTLAHLPRLLHNGGLPLPAERLRLAGGDTESLATRPLPPKTAAAVATVIADLSRIARTSHGHAVRQLAAAPRRARAALLPLAMAEPYFRGLSGLSGLDRVIEVSTLYRLVRIGKAHLTGRL